MTHEERIQYDKLSYSQKNDYEIQKSRRPNWSHDQIMAKVFCEAKIDDSIDGGHDVDPDDPIFMKYIMSGAQELMKGMGIVIVELFNWFDDVIGQLNSMISRGIRRIGSALKDVFGWLFS